MPTWGLIFQYVFSVISAAGIIGGLFFNAYAVRGENKTLREEIKTRRIGNLLAVTANHREIWAEPQRNEKLSRVNDPNADTVNQPVTDAEMTFLSVVIQHMSSAYYVMNDQSVVHLEGFRQDVADYLSLPIPKIGWEKAKQYQNADFVEFVESCLKTK